MPQNRETDGDDSTKAERQFSPMTGMVTALVSLIPLQTFDSRGNLVRILDAATNIVGKANEGVGNLAYLTNRNGGVWQFHYDGANRLTNTISPLGRRHERHPNTACIAMGQLPARLTAEQAGWVLNCQSHDIPALIHARPLKPLGSPAQNSPKYFATAELLEVANDRAWLVKATVTINAHWRNQNSRKQRSFDSQEKATRSNTLAL